MADVFISYAAEDRAWTGELAAGLRRNGVRVFFDECSLLPGDVVVHQLEAAIRCSTHGIQVLSPVSMRKPWVLQEYAALLDASTRRGLRLIPVLHSDVDIGELPFAATRLWVDFRDVTGAAFHGKVSELARVILGEEPTGNGESEALDLRDLPARSPDPPAEPSFVVCYARQERDYARRLLSTLSRAGLPVWSIGHLAWGDDVLRTIRTQIRHALGIIVLMSPEAEGSEDVTREILEGQRHSRPFFPILVRGDRHFLLGSTWHFDARTGSLPGYVELDLLRRLQDAGAPSPAPDQPVARAGRTGVSAAVSPVPAAVRTAAPAPAAGLLPGAPAGVRLGALLAEGEWEHADVLTTALLLRAVDRLESGWLRRGDGRRLPAGLLREVDAAWAESSGGRYGFRAQRERARPASARHRDFLALSVAYGWRGSVEDAVSEYRAFTGTDRPPGFFPTLRNPQNERYPDWYDQWTETVLAVHLRLRTEGGAA
ncbi:TIR domain-containing protein [Streptomyces synnematoformans]|uniref:TIR domain-containing protein n=1 Tax=Streptomyces synnematoformans TaxID=415721 RepID=A0ABP5JIT1_9ACTN